MASAQTEGQALIKQEMVLSVALHRGSSFVPTLLDLCQKIDDVQKGYELIEVDFEDTAEDAQAYNTISIGTLVVTFLKRPPVAEGQLRVSVGADTEAWIDRMSTAATHAEAVAEKIEHARREEAARIAASEMKAPSSATNSGAFVYGPGGSLPAGIVGELIRRVDTLERTVNADKQQSPDSVWDCSIGNPNRVKREAEAKARAEQSEAEGSRIPVQTISEAVESIREIVLNQIATGVPAFSDQSSALGAIEGAIRAERTRIPSPGRQDMDQYRFAMQRIAATCVRELIRTGGRRGTVSAEL